MIEHGIFSNVCNIYIIMVKPILQQNFKKKRFSITFPDIPSVYYRYVFFQFAVYCIAIAKPCLFLPRVRPLFAKPFLTGGLGPSLFVTFIAFGAFTHAFYLVRKASQVLKLLVDL